MTDERIQKQIEYYTVYLGLDPDERCSGDAGYALDALKDLQQCRARFAELEATLAYALRHWQHGIGSLNNEWRIRMGEILGDTEGLPEEAAQAAIAGFEKKKTT